MSIFQTTCVVLFSAFLSLSCFGLSSKNANNDKRTMPFINVREKKSKSVSPYINKYIQGSLIVSVNDFDKDYKTIEFDEIKANRVKEIFKGSSSRLFLVEYDASKSSSFEVTKRALENRNDIVNVEQDQIGEWFDVLPNDYDSSLDWYVSKIKLDKAWNICTGSASTKIGIIDTGIDSSHPDFNGRLDTSLGISFSPNSTNPYQPCHPHGTWVAGIVGAKGDNGLCISGVNWNCSLVSLRVDGEANGFYDEFGVLQQGCQEKLSSVISAINYAQNNNIPILNFSGGFDNDSDLLEDAINDYDGLLICACGNHGLSLENRPVYPACYDCPNIISVGATNSSDYMSGTNYSSISVDLFAPGTSIRGLEMGTSGVCTDSGTSAAAPIVSGVAGLIKSLNPSLTSLQIKNVILCGVDPISNLNGYCVTGGRLNVLKTVSLALNDHLTLPSGGVQTRNNVLSPYSPLFNNFYFNSENYIRINSIPGTFDFETIGDLTTIGTLLDLDWNILANAGDNGNGHNFKFTYTFTTFESFILKITGTGISSSIGLTITNHHSHHYDDSYFWVSDRKHRAICECSEYILQGHACLSSNPHICSLCGGYADMGFIGPFNAILPSSFNNVTSICNDSLLFANGNILVGPIDESLIVIGELTYGDLYEYELS